MVNKQPVGAHYGVRDWLAQRVTAVYMALFALIAFVWVVTHLPYDSQAWQALFASTFVKVTSLLFLLCVYLHAWVGVRDILMDYVKPTGLRLTLQVIVIGTLLAYTIWSVSILWSV